MMRTAFLSLVLPAAAATCLVNGTAPINRKLLVNPDTGESYPVGVWVAQWAAAEATSYMVGILIEEMLGFNVTYSFGPGTPDGYYAIAGCSSPNDAADRGCIEGQVSYQHVHTETWLSGYDSNWNAVQKFQNAPKALTSMGYDGFVASYFTKRELDTAYDTEGLALDFWTAFDSTWNQPWKYFDNPSVVNRSETLPCSQSNFYEDNIMRLYLTWSGDTGGVIAQPDGSLIGNCQDGYFWQAPACRGNIANCIVYFTGGKGYSLTETMQKSAKWNMPLAIGIGATWSDFVSLPSKHKSLFYWWVPDPTFLAMDPVKSTFPDYNKQEWANGDQTSASCSMPIHKIVSRDLSSLAPRIEMFVDNFIIDMASLNKILKEQISSGDDWKSVACGWLQNNQETWQAWLPDESTCFPTLGLYNTITDEFVPDRSNKDGLVCRACPSGTYSVQLSDNDGLTYICQDCPPGTSQSNGASLTCEPCAKGLFQDQSGQLGCKRCEVGTYQDEEGGPTCKQCPANSRTLALGSVAFGDCGCEENYIDVGSEGNLTCALCQTGLLCPLMGTEESLKNGSHPLGEGYTPQILKGYYAKSDSPLEVYKCGKVFQCPGGLPNTCAGGLTGTPCAECPQGQTYNDGCEECELWRQFAWVIGAFCCLFVLTLSYYLMTSKVTAKASVLFTTTCAFGMLVSLLQSIGIIGSMTVEFPVNIKGIFAFMSIFVLDLESFGFACFAGANTAFRYSVSVILFPVAVGWLAVNFGVSKLVPRHAWDSTKVISCMGQVLQVGFSTMSAVALAPFMCYTHPNTKLSLLKYPNILCGSDEHALMLVGGSLLLVIGVFGFLTLCTYAAYRVPSWSATEKHRYVRCFRFLVFRFRLVLMLLYFVHQVFLGHLCGGPQGPEMVSVLRHGFRG